MASTTLGLYGGPAAILTGATASGITVSPETGALTLTGIAPFIAASTADFLTINGSLLRVITGSFQQGEGVRVGDEARTATGRLRSTVSGIKRRWSVNVAFITTAEFEAFRAQIEPDLHVTAAGQLLRGDTPTVRVSVVGAEAQEYNGDLLWIVGLDVVEV